MATMTQTVTAEQVKAAMEAAGITRVNHHDCAGCGYMTSYVLSPQGELFFDPGCWCTMGVGGGLRPGGFESAAGWINMQPSADVQRRLAAAFGITLE
jgi:hypothetical protein